MNQDSGQNSEKAVEQQSPTKKRSWRRKLVILLTLGLLGGVGGGALYGWYFIQRKLVPLIETEAGNYLHRPLELGELKSISLSKASFGESSLPATVDNPDFVDVTEVRLKFALWHFIRRQELKLDLILVRPDIYIEQDESKLWTPTDFGSDEESEGGIQVDVKSIQLSGGQLSLVAYNAEKAILNPAVIAKVDHAVISPQDGEIKFDLAAELLQGGKFTVDGVGYNSTGDIELDVVAQKLSASAVSNLLALPIELHQGNLNGGLQVLLTDAPVPQLQGALKLEDVNLQIPNLVRPFSQSWGQVLFDGSLIELDNIKTNFGQVSGSVIGSLDLAGTGDYQIDARVQPVAAPQVLDALELEAPVPVQGRLRGQVSVRGGFENTTIAFKLASAGRSRIDKIDFRQLNADLELVGTTLKVKEFDSSPVGGGRFSGQGQMQLAGLQDMEFVLRGQNVSALAIAKGYGAKLPVPLERISGTTNILAQAGDLTSLKFKEADLAATLGGGVIKLSDLDYQDGIWTSQLTTKGVAFGSLPMGKGSAPNLAKGLVDSQLKVSGTSELTDLNQIAAQGSARINTVGGQISLPQIDVTGGNWQGDVITANLKLQRLFPDLPDEFNDNLSGKFYLSGNIPDAVQPQTLINGFGDLSLAEGSVEVQDLKIVDQDWSAIALGNNLKLKELSSSTPEQFAGLVDGQLELKGTTDNITPEGIAAVGDATLTLPEGIFGLEQLTIADGRFRTEVVPQQVELSLFGDPNSDDLELNGFLGGRLNVAGKVDNLSPTAVAGQGSLRFSQGIDLLEQPFTAQINWDGRNLDVRQAKGDGLDAQGQIVLDSSFFSDIPDKLAAVDYFEFQVAEARWLDIRKLRLTLPTWAVNLDYSGRGDFVGQLSGIPSAMKINGNVGLKNFRVEDVEFAPFLVGNVQTSPDIGVKLSLQEVLTTPLLPATADFGAESQPLDKIELVLAQDFSPLTVALIQDYSKVEGVGKNDILELKTTNIPVPLLKTIALKSEDIEVPDNIALQAVDGNLSGDFRFNLKTLATSGEDVVIDNPALASIRGDRLKGDFQYADGYFAIQDVEFTQRNSIYQLKGQLSQKPDDLELDGRISIEQGQIQDILIALQIFELSDFARIFSSRNYSQSQELYRGSGQSEDDEKRPSLFAIKPQQVGGIWAQLTQLAEVQAWLNSRQQKRDTAILPEIKNLQGTFNGQVEVFGSLNNGLTSKFDFLGQKWRWGNLVGEKIVAEGTLQDGILTLLPISITFRDPTPLAPKTKSQRVAPKLVFTGTYGGVTQSGQFRLVEVPLKLIDQLFSFPEELTFAGLINATASIAGTRDEPQARGEIRLDDASLNETLIQSTKGSFNYRKSRLEFSAESFLAKDVDPLVLKGSVPYQLPFAQVKPEDNRLELKLNVKDKGLALLDIFSRGELRWIDGQGDIALDISGILDTENNLPRKLTTTGNASIKNATIFAKNLPKNLLTNIDSRIFFDFDEINVNNFQGNFGGGNITATGKIPLRESDSPNPLVINFNQIKKIDLPKLYSGGVAGKLEILGKATEPNITGDLTLFDGTILLSDEIDSNASTLGDSRIPSIFRNSVDNFALRPGNGLAAATQYRGLKLRFGENIQISQPPIFTFLAKGNLNINGTYLQPSPDGTIFLERGQVNLFTTQLNLSRDYRSTARFSSNNNTIDPFLDILLVGSAIETTDRSTPSEVSPNEIPVSNLRALETIRVAAKVKGFASQITDRLELTSSPPRSEAEIAALLGGGFVEALANSNGTSGLATLAGSALFGSLNSEFNNVFPIGELRLFPTPIIDENRDRQTDGIAGEIAFDLINNLSFSVLKILNNDLPAQFGVRYRLDDNFVLRGSSTFQENGSRGLLEYELRF